MATSESGSESEYTSSRSPSPILPSKQRSKNKDNESWDYKPPVGTTLVDNSKLDAGVFDWDALNKDKDSELWVIRVPMNVSLKHLQTLTLTLPSSSSTNTRVGKLTRKDTAYDVWQVGDPPTGESTSDEGLNQNDTQHHIAAEELKSFSALLPRKKRKGDLYPAPRPIARRLVIAPPPPIPSLPTSFPSEPTSSSDPTLLFQSQSGVKRHTNPPRHSYPESALKHQYLPTGSFSCPATTARSANGETAADVSMQILEDDDDEIVEILAPAPTASQKTRTPKKVKDERITQKTKDEKKEGSKQRTPAKGKKRKVDESPTGAVASAKKAKTT